MGIDPSSITNRAFKLKMKRGDIYMWDISIHIELGTHQ